MTKLSRPVDRETDKTETWMDYPGMKVLRTSGKEMVVSTYRWANGKFQASLRYTDIYLQGETQYFDQFQDAIAWAESKIAWSNSEYPRQL